MSNIVKCQTFLRELELPEPQTNKIAALTLLALLDIKQTTAWSRAKKRSLRVHDILQWINKYYRKNYKENTRESIRRQVLHQFEQARIVNRNPDNPNLATNSPLTHYAVTKEIHSLVCAQGKRRRYTKLLKEFISKRQASLDIYTLKRKKKMIKVKTSSGELVELSPGKHNVLQASILDEFVPRFLNQAELLYLGDTAKKDLFLEKRKLSEIGITLSRHQKLPDIVLFDKKRKRLFLIEAVTSHGPISQKRKIELDKMLSKCKLTKVYVTCFPAMVEFKKFITKIAWETEVWISEIPDHMIHYNGESFLKTN